jgi:hypothetical protein
MLDLGHALYKNSSVPAINLSVEYSSLKPLVHLLSLFQIPSELDPTIAYGMTRLFLQHQQPLPVNNKPNYINFSALYKIHHLNFINFFALYKIHHLAISFLIRTALFGNLTMFY